MRFCEKRIDGESPWQSTISFGRGGGESPWVGLLFLTMGWPLYMQAYISPTSITPSALGRLWFSSYYQHVNAISDCNAIIFPSHLHTERETHFRVKFKCRNFTRNVCMKNTYTNSANPWMEMNSTVMKDYCVLKLLGKNVETCSIWDGRILLNCSLSQIFHSVGWDPTLN